MFRLIAASTFHVPVDRVSDRQRQHAKGICYGVCLCVCLSLSVCVCVCVFGRGVFRLIAASTFHVPVDRVSDRQRQHAKGICYGVCVCVCLCACVREDVCLVCVRACVHICVFVVCVL